jgi:hypothetical protein
MKLNSKISVVLTVSFLSFSACSEMKSNDCVSCTKKSVPESVQPDKKTALELKNDVSKPLALAMKGTLVITKSDGRTPAGEVVKGGSKDSYQGAFCMQFERAEDTVDIDTLIENMNASPYASSFNEFWTTPACHAPLKNDTTVPILFNTASDPQKSEDFPLELHDYLVGEKKDSATWLKAINTTTNDGYTFLDYMQYNISRGFYSYQKDKDAAIRVVNYLCKNGGVYNKFKDTVKCP